MQIVSLEQIKAALRPHDAIAAVKQAFIDFANGQIQQPEPMQILFHQQDGTFHGDCHIKAAQQVKAAQGQNLPYFSIKVATGFYDNAAKGLPVNNGMILLLSAETGQPVALLQDEGWLTQIRTAAAGALAAGLKPVTPKDGLGIIGAGTQAEQQARLITEHLGLKRVAIHARNMDRAHELCIRLQGLGLEATAVSSAAALCQVSTIVVTTTPATQPVLGITDIAEDLHIVALGADSPGKSEIAPEIFASAGLIVTDSHTQCLQHGDFGNAVRTGHIPATADVSLGKLLSGQDRADLSLPGISIVDLTGLGAQDLAIANQVMRCL